MLSMKVKNQFFDRQAVIRELNKVKRQAYSKAGGVIRLTARRSIREKPYRTYSKPGQPPYSHGAGLLRRKIFYAYDRTRDSVVIGPVGFKGSNVPNVLEFGGAVKRSRNFRGRKRGSTAYIKPRPYMGPALRKHQTEIVSSFERTVGRPLYSSVG